MASRDLRHLQPRTRQKVERALAACRADPELGRVGLTVLVTCTWRSDEDQERLYAQGRTEPGPIVTRARAGESDHNKVNAKKEPASSAVDIVPLRYGKPVWGTGGDGLDENPADDHTDDLEAWQRCAVHFKREGLRWYGEPGSPFRELPHFHDPEDYSEAREAPAGVSRARLQGGTA